STIFALRSKRDADRATELAVKATTEADRATASERLTRRYLYSARMNLAHDAWKRGDVPLLLELLDQHRPREGEEDLRSFEWRYLWYKANSQRQTFRLPSSGPHPVAYAASPDGHWLAVGHMELDVLSA